MLNSEHREYQEKIKALKAERDAAYAAALRFVTGVINTNGDLDAETKTSLIKAIWSK